MKRWIVYLLVLVGVHIYFISLLNSANKPHREEMKRIAAPSYTIPNWSNPKQDDIFMVKDMEGVIRSYKIVEGVLEGKLSLRMSNYQFSTDLKESMVPEKWNFEFMNNPALYADSIRQVSLDEFQALKDDAYFTRGFRLQSTKNPLHKFLYLYNHYQILVKGLICFFTIWLFTALNSRLSPFLSFSREKLLIIFTAILFYLSWLEMSIYIKEFWVIFYYYVKLLLMSFSIFYLVGFLNEKGLRRWTFSDREAVKFTMIALGGFLLSCVFVYLQYLVIKSFNINLFVHKFNGQFTNLRIYLIPFYAISWLAIATGNFLNNFRIHFFQLRRKAKAFKYARVQELEFKSELETLQAKINPHFLYNSLNSIASLAQSDPEKTETMALALSKFYKEKTNRKESVWSTVAEEMDMLKTYLDIEKIRFGDRLEVTLNSPDIAGMERIPRFLLQPLVENAIKYGYNSNDNNIVVKIIIERSFEHLTIHILDGGPAFSDNLNTGYGIRSVQKKLKLFYPNSHQMEFINHPEKQVFIQVKS